MPNKIIPQEHRKAMVEAYLKGATAKEAAAPFGYSLMACIFALRRTGIQPRCRAEASRKYSIDESFFDHITNESQAYWLGFLTADGTIGAKFIDLKLKQDDAEHTRKFANVVHTSQPIITRTVSHRYYCSHIHINSIRLATSLKNMGVGERKSLTVKPCSEVPSHLLPHYWRGVFDGDGFISKSRSRRTGSIRWTIGLVGNKEIVDGFARFCGKYINSRASVCRHGNIFIIRYNGVALPKAVANLLYEDATIYLERKKRLVNEICSTQIQRPRCALNLKTVADSWSETLNACERGEVHAARQVLPDEAGTEHRLGGQRFAIA